MSTVHYRVTRIRPAVLERTSHPDCQAAWLSVLASWVDLARPKSNCSIDCVLRSGTNGFCCRDQSSPPSCGWEQTPRIRKTIFAGLRCCRDAYFVCIYTIYYIIFIFVFIFIFICSCICAHLALPATPRSWPKPCHTAVGGWPRTRNWGAFQSVLVLENKRECVCLDVRFLST